MDNGELHDLYSASNIILVMKSERMTDLGHVAMQGAEEKYVKVLVGKPEGQRQLGRPKHRWEDNIKMYLTHWHTKPSMRRPGSLGPLIHSRV